MGVATCRFTTDDGGMDTQPSSTIDAELSFVPARAGSGPELVIRYDGTEPPTDLFAALEALGCGHVVAEPPPRSAIDWTTPDPRRGTRYTIASYVATAHLPLSAAEGGSMAARAATLASDSGVRVVGDLASPAPGSRVDGDRVEGNRVETNRVDGNRVDGNRGSRGDVEVAVCVDAHREPALVAAVDGLARCIEREATELCRTNTYRGRTCETRVPAIRLVLLVGRDQLDDLMSTISPLAAEAPRVLEAH